MSRSFKILLFGANGQVGSECLLQFQQQDWLVQALTRNEVDFCHPDAIYEAILNIRPDIVVNACAYTAVDKAETEADIAQAVNADSVAVMAKACAQLGIPTIHISTDYVFSGEATAPYKEGDAVSPLGIYGTTKLLGEQRLSLHNPQHIVLRTSWVFGAHGNNFVKTMLRLAARRDESGYPLPLSVVADQHGCPTYATDIATVITKLLVQYQSDHTLPWGIYHCTNQGECNWYEFALAIFAQAKTLGVLSDIPEVNAITTAQYPTLAKRPAYSVMSGTKLASLLDSPMPHWRDGLTQMLKAEG